MSTVEMTYPYLVVRVMAAVYQRVEIGVHIGEPLAHVGFRDTFVHYPTPFAMNGALSQGCRVVLIAAAIVAVQRLRCRMCLVWAAGECSFIERDGSVTTTGEVPRGGYGSGGVDGIPLPIEVAFDQ